MLLGGEDVTGYLANAEVGDWGRMGLLGAFEGAQVDEPSVEDWSLVSENRSFSCCSAKRNGSYS